MSRKASFFSLPTKYCTTGFHSLIFVPLPLVSQYAHKVRLRAQLCQSPIPYQDLAKTYLLHFVQCLEALPNTVQLSVQTDLWEEDEIKISPKERMHTSYGFCILMAKEPKEMLQGLLTFIKFCAFIHPAYHPSLKHLV